MDYFIGCFGDYFIGCCLDYGFILLFFVVVVAGDDVLDDCLFINVVLNDCNLKLFIYA